MQKLDEGEIISVGGLVSEIRAEKDQFWVSRNGKVGATPMSREQVQADLIEAGAGLETQLMKIGEDGWKSAADHGFVIHTENQSPQDKYTSSGPSVFKEGTLFAYAVAKSDRERREVAEAIAKALNKASNVS